MKTASISTLIVQRRPLLPCDLSKSQDCSLSKNSKYIITPMGQVPQSVESCLRTGLESESGVVCLPEKWRIRSISLSQLDIATVSLVSRYGEVVHLSMPSNLDAYVH